MRLTTFSYAPPKGWTVDSLPDMDSENTLAVVFGAPGYLKSPEKINQLVRRYPRSRVVGCSTAGEILGTSLSDGTLVVAVVAFEKTEVASAFAAVSRPEESFEAGARIAQQLNDASLRGVLVLSDGLKVNGSELVRGLNSVFNPGVVVTGGLAGDGDRFQLTWVIKDGQPRSGFITAVGFYGDHVRIGHGSKGGWDTFGPERRVTKSNGSVLYELDGKPALQLYKQYLGDLASGLPATALLFPLALRSDPSDENQVVRTVLGVDERAQSMTFAGDIPQGCLAQLMKASLDRLIDGASEAALMTRRNYQSEQHGQTLSLAISCVGRRLILGERAEDELEAALEVLPKGAEQIGFYSYGEISPYASGRCDLHNQTMTLTTINEL